MNCIEAYDVANQSFVNGFNLANNHAFRNSQIELGYDNNLYVVNSTEFARISNPDNPQNSLLTIAQQINYNNTFEVPNACINPIIDLDTTYVLPKQIDGEDPFARFSENCCEIVDGMGDYYTATTGISTWSPGQNPFGNANNQVLINGYLKIPTGATVHINNMTFSFAQNAEMIIEKGAKVYLNNSILTSDACNGIMWEGVRVYGTSNGTQSFANQGYLNMQNNSEINNAYIGVALHKRDNSGNIDWATNGGRIIAKNSKFRNNKRDVIFLTYNNYTSGSNFTNCDFLTNIHPLADGVSTPNTHVSMLDVKGIKFNGCRFNNTTNSNIAQRGKGIVSIDAGYEVSFHCNALVPWGSPCPTNDRIISSFSNLEYGIEARAANNMANTITVKYTDFFENNRATYFNNIPTYTYVNNTIKLGNSISPSHTWPYGLYSDGCTGYIVENNSFTTAYGGNSYGIVMSNSNNNGTTPDQNEVYHNYFNNLNFAVFNLLQNVQINGGNPVGGTGVTYRCNDFNNSATTDIFEGFSGAGGISIHQGSCANITSPSNNLYSAVNPAYSNVWNNNAPNYQLTTTIGNNGPSRLTPTVYNPAITHNTYCAPDYDETASCPVKAFDVLQLKPWVLGGKIADLENEIKADKDFVTETDKNVALLWDKALNNSISWTQFKDNVINNYSPYVSLQSLTDIISYSNEIPHGYIKELLMSNYPLAFSTIDALNNSDLPTNIITQIIENNPEGTNTREELNNKIHYYDREIALLDRNIVKYYLTDSIENNNIDSLIMYIEEKNDESTKQFLVDLYRANNQNEKASILLEEISNSETASDFVDFETILINNSNVYTINVSNNDFNIISELTDPEYKSFIGGRAATVKEYIDDITIEEVEPFVIKNSYMNSEELEDSNEDNSVIIYPNPTDGVITIELLLENNTTTNYEIVNSIGEITKSGNLSNLKSYIELTDIPNGIYFIKIHANETIVKKIIKK